MKAAVEPTEWKILEVSCSSPKRSHLRKHGFPNLQSDAHRTSSRSKRPTGWRTCRAAGRAWRRHCS
eukprot:11167582-Heterocapsa_arctica.AAC.1